MTSGVAMMTSLLIRQGAGAGVAASKRTPHPGAPRATIATATTARIIRRDPITAATTPRRPRRPHEVVAGVAGTRRPRRHHAGGGTAAEAREESTHRPLRRRRRHAIRVVAAETTAESVPAKASRKHHQWALAAQKRLRLQVEKGEQTKTKSADWDWPRQSTLSPPLRVDTNCATERHSNGRHTWGTRPQAVAGKAARTRPKVMRRAAAKLRKRVAEEAEKLVARWRTHREDERVLLRPTDAWVKTAQSSTPLIKLVNYSLRLGLVFIINNLTIYYIIQNYYY